MFIRHQEFKKLLDEAYKTVGIRLMGVEMLDEERTIISGNFWAVDVRTDCIPKKIKALIIEYCEDLPKVGERILCRKGELNTYIQDDEIPECMRVSKVMLEEKKEMKAAMFTNIVVREGMREKIMMSIKDQSGANVQKILVYSIIRNMISNSIIDEDDGENAVLNGWYQEKRHGVYFENDVMSMMVLVHVPHEEDMTINSLLASMRTEEVLETI